ncbi:Rgg/GadR/MutR family transcriptional regulator [Pseudolactococcus yaeyamensis]
MLLTMLICIFTLSCDFKVKDGEMMELESLGSFFKATREIRGYSLRDIETDYLDNSQLSRFENDKAMLSSDRLMLAIAGLNMTPTEFFSRKSGFEQTKLHLFSKKISHYTMTRDFEGLKSLIKAKARKKEDRIFNILVKCSLVDVPEVEVPITVSDRKFVEGYLLSIEQWTIFEVSIFGMCLDAFDEVEVYELSLELLKRNEFSQLITYHTEVVKKTIQNVYVHLICKGWYVRAERIAEELEKLLTDWDMEEKILFYIFRKFAKFRQEKNLELLKEIQDDIQILKRFGVAGVATRIEMIIENYQ